MEAHHGGLTSCFEKYTSFFHYIWMMHHWKNQTRNKGFKGEENTENLSQFLSLKSLLTSVHFYSARWENFVKYHVSHFLLIFLLDYMYIIRRYRMKLGCNSLWNASQTLVHLSYLHFNTTEKMVYSAGAWNIQGTTINSCKLCNSCNLMRAINSSKLHDHVTWYPHVMWVLISNSNF